MIRQLTVEEHFFRDCLMEMGQLARELEGQLYIFDKIVKIIRSVREQDGRLFFCGVGGGAGNGAHAAGDLFKSCKVKAICLTDNVPTLTAVTNDDGWDKVFMDQLWIWGLKDNDALFVLSVGGGDEEKNISANIVKAVQFAKSRNVPVLGIVGKKDGFTAQNGDAVIVVPNVKSERMTTHTEGMQNYIMHFVTEFLRLRSAKWESQMEKK